MLEYLRVWHFGRIVVLHTLHPEVVLVFVRALRAACLAHRLGARQSLQLDLLSGHAVGQLFLVVFKNLFTRFPFFIALAHHAVEDHLTAPPRDEQLEGCVLIVLKFKIARSKFLEKVIDGSGVLLLLAATTFNNGQEFSKLNFFGSVLVDELHYLLDLLTVLNQAKSNKRVLKLVNADRPRLIVIKTVEVLSKLLQLLVFKNNTVVFAVLAQPLSLLTFRVVDQVRRFDFEVFFVFIRVFIFTVVRLVDL